MTDIPLIKMKISYCIISDGKEPDKLERQINSIHALNVPEYEIIVAGNPNVGADVDFIVRMPNTAKQGRLGALRNGATSCASGEIIVVSDDDIIFHGDWYDGFKSFDGEWDVMSCRILNPDGTRYWDWKAHLNGMNMLLDYDEINELVSLTGGFKIIKAHVLERVQWDDELGFNQAEDVDFSNKIKAAGFKIVMNKNCTVTHDAPYTQMDKGVHKVV